MESSRVTAASKLADARRLAPSRWGVLFGLAALTGLVLRVWAYRSVSGTPNADEAVVGLMARHAVDGEFTTFYWGQAYGGTQEVLLTVPVFLLAGSSWFALRLVPIVLSVVAALLVWRVGRRTIGEPAAAVAGCLFWIWPPFNISVLTHQQGFYATNILYCALLLLLALRVVERPDRVRVGLFGLVTGLAFWQTPQIVPLAAGVIAWTVWRQPRCLRYLHVAVPLALLGALPWLYWNIEHGWESLAQPEYGDKLRSLRLLASPVLPMITGLRVPFSAELLLPPAALTYVVYVAVIGLFILGAVRAKNKDASILYAVTALFPIVYALSPKTSLALSTPRFIVVLTPLLALLLAQIATTYLRAIAVLALAGAISVVTLNRMEDWFRGTPRQTTHEEGLGPRHTVQWVPRDLGPLVSTLERLDLNHVYADYWLAYRLTFDTRERVIAAENALEALTFEGGQAIPSTPEPGRYPPYSRRVRKARHGFVFYEQHLDSIPIVPELRRHGYRRHDVGSFVVYAPPRSADADPGPVGSDPA
jgi:Dolichyl-phosphate-mannose-protein mannosyltransferase